MTQESMEWLNTQTLIGFTEVRGNAWHYRAALQGDEPNSYPRAVPVEDVRRRLFQWQALESPLFTLDANANAREVPDRKAIIRSDTGDVLGVFKSGYQPHQYDEWLVRNVETILDDTLQIGSAGLLRNGAQAWVSVEVPDNITTPSGVVFRPQLIAATSFDGSLATTYKRSAQVVVCDNTLQAGLQGDGERFRLKHTRYSGLRIQEARDALAIIYDTADAVSQEIERLLSIDVKAPQFSKVLDILVPVTDKFGKPLEQGRGLTSAINKREAVARLYTRDERVAPWNGTGYGVLAAFNTYGQHLGIVRNASRAQRNASNALGNSIAESDDAVIATLEKVLAEEMTFAG